MQDCLNRQRSHIKWVLSYGVQAEVLEPKEMRDEIVEELRNCLGQYVRARVSS